MTGHPCPARGCAATVPAKLFMCDAHWRALPKPMRDVIRRRWRPGPEGIRRDLCERRPRGAELQRTVTEAIAWLADREQRRGLLAAAIAAGRHDPAPAAEPRP